MSLSFRFFLLDCGGLLLRRRRRTKAVVNMVWREVDEKWRDRAVMMVLVDEKWRDEVKISTLLVLVSLYV